MSTMKKLFCIGAIFYVLAAAALAQTLIQSPASTGNISSSALVSTTATGTHMYVVYWTVSLTVTGTGCSGNTTVNLNLIFTDPNAASTVTEQVAALTIATGGNGTVGFVANGSDTVLNPRCCN